MIEPRPFSELGSTELSWLKAKLHFAFAGMGNSQHLRVGALRVWNDDEFAPGSGFPLHFHSDVEIITEAEDQLNTDGATFKQGDSECAALSTIISACSARS